MFFRILLTNTKKMKKKILITNDDGINARGIEKLIKITRKYADVFVIAPTKGMSGMSHAITVNKPLFINKLENFDFPFYSCSGTPVDGVKMCLDIFFKEKKPDFIFSGINHGANHSISLIYSGTMGAAMEGVICGIPSVGFSLDSHMPDADFSQSEEHLEKIIATIIKNGIPAETALNINIPNVKKEKIKGVKICRQTKGLWEEQFKKNYTPLGKEYYWMTGKYVNLEKKATDTDMWALDNNYIAIVPVQQDLTAYKKMSNLIDLI